MITDQVVMLTPPLKTNFLEWNRFESGEVFENFGVGM